MHIIIRDIQYLFDILINIQIKKNAFPRQKNPSGMNFFCLLLVLLSQGTNKSLIIFQRSRYFSAIRVTLHNPPISDSWLLIWKARRVSCNGSRAGEALTYRLRACLQVIFRWMVFLLLLAFFLGVAACLLRFYIKLIQYRLFCVLGSYLWLYGGSFRQTTTTTERHDQYR